MWQASLLTTHLTLPLKCSITRKSLPNTWTTPSTLTTLPTLNTTNLPYPLVTLLLLPRILTTRPTRTTPLT